MVKGLTTD